MRRELSILAALVGLGIALEALGVVDWRLASGVWRSSGRGPMRGQLAVTIVLAQFALYTFAQPGSILFWVAALLYCRWCGSRFSCCLAALRSAGWRADEEPGPQASGEPVALTRVHRRY